ncbi:MAG: hypothetical protein R3230_01290 [Nitrosopumilaceae archaeon]|nr:hypothetical protein [Nitrosopumilaceae archaeon]
MPSKTYENEMGEKKYMPYLRFSDTKVFERFQDSAKRAIDEWCLKQSEDQHFNKQVEEQQEEIPF